MDYTTPPNRTFKTYGSLENSESNEFDVDSPIVKTRKRRSTASFIFCGSLVAAMFVIGELSGTLDTAKANVEWVSSASSSETEDAETSVFHKEPEKSNAQKQDVLMLPPQQSTENVSAGPPNSSAINPPNTSLFGGVASPEFVDITLTYTDFTKFPAVKRFLIRQGIDIDGNVTKDHLYKYVPREVVVRINPALVKHEIGEMAMGGHVAFDLVFMNTTNQYLASYFCVIDIYGNLTTVVPLYSEREELIYRPLGLKLKNSSTFIIGAGEVSIVGPRVMLNWKTGDWEFIADKKKGNAHDIQMGYARETFWQPTLGEFDINTGDEVKTFTIKDTFDVNHAQLIQEDATAILSSRGTSSILKVNARSGVVHWTLGGEYGDAPIIDLDGSRYEKGASLWHGQHNAEYFGDGEYMMFDNQYNNNNNSRMLIVEYHGSGSAEITWAYEMDGYTPHFGDCDRLPTGNILGCAWPQVVYQSENPDFDVRALEVVRSTNETAWEMTVYGERCINGHKENEAECGRTLGQGWTMYSVERFYTKPLVYNVTCSRHGHEHQVYFNTHNIFKQNNYYEGNFRVVTKLDGVLQRKTFDFTPHWRETIIQTNFSAIPREKYYVYVENQWKDENMVEFECET